MPRSRSLASSLATGITRWSFAGHRPRPRPRRPRPGKTKHRRRIEVQPSTGIAAEAATTCIPSSQSPLSWWEAQVASRRSGFCHRPRDVRTPPKPAEAQKGWSLRRFLKSDAAEASRPPAERARGCFRSDRKRSPRRTPRDHQCLELSQSRDHRRTCAQESIASNVCLQGNHGGRRPHVLWFRPR